MALEPIDDVSEHDCAECREQREAKIAAALVRLSEDRLTPEDTSLLIAELDRVKSASTKPKLKEFPLVLQVDEETHEVFLNNVKVGEYNHDYSTEKKVYLVIENIVELLDKYFG
jgi:hypothetical protein